MLRNGVCRPSSSPWSNYLILVKKKDGTMRFAIDYGLLNDITKKDAYPNPDIQTILDKTHHGVGRRTASLHSARSERLWLPIRSCCAILSGATIHVEADAPSVGIAAVLSQDDPTTGVLQPMIYFSSALNQTQMKYSAEQREAWAIVSVTGKWHDYLKGATGIMVLTDHNSLA
ncbi:Retrotransposon protein [Oopsacas minuta]|uniref:Retrotransposon protein n=1 Tax=Oopsacas minuta TaxID=111878 RepID=A0AAV7K0D4_9METZ|nr:Retrotransposon protein [Oopsacas minuta]